MTVGCSSCVEHEKHEKCRRSSNRINPNTTARISRARSGGAVLPIVLLITAMMLGTSAAWFEASLAAMRSTTNVRDYLQAFHAADSALNLCARNVVAAVALESSASDPPATGEPQQWKNAAAFEAGAVAPVAQWPGSVRAPRCLIEPWRLSARADAKAYLLTARGFGRTQDSQVWLQMELVIADEHIERHWRRVAARPF
ncbi:PilX N-terminal domain-containing pilus assembly protein [Paraburkholderia xenovorans]|uniref:pilus assembly PilX family protein n=1 Tax=Paraburkholderia xenovorans TaxID=36873 RepID=UPI0038B95033